MMFCRWPIGHPLRPAPDRFLAMDGEGCLGQAIEPQGLPHGC